MKPIDEKKLWPLIEKTDTCWLWHGPLKKGRPTYFGYGYSIVRIVYNLVTNTEIPMQARVYRSCGNTLCVNPDHQIVGDEARFNFFITKTETCWLWNGWRDEHGYGHFNYGDSKTSAHRYAWELVNGPITDGLFVCHHCDNPPCVNPKHLFLGTPADNSKDMSNKGRAYSPKGTKNKNHTFTDEQVLEIRSLKANQPVTKTAKEYGVTHSAISNILLGKTWKHLL